LKVEKHQLASTRFGFYLTKCSKVTFLLKESGTVTYPLGGPDKREQRHLP